MNRIPFLHLILTYTRPLVLTIIFPLLFICPGCSTGPHQPSERQQIAIESNQRAENAYKKRNYIKALNHYMEALNISRSLENADSMGSNIVNIAYVYYRMGEREKSHTYADLIINKNPFEYSVRYLIDAMSIKALLYCDESNGKEASFWADKALNLCQGVSCREEGRIYNIRARASLLNKDIKAATEYAKKGLEINKKIDDVAEMGNSMRIMADIELMNKNYEASRGLYKDALLIDKSLELSDKMINDLLGIAVTFEKQGRPNEALPYYRRAISISEGMGNMEMEKSIREKIEKMQPQKNT